jgi:hypothetical protein
MNVVESKARDRRSAQEFRLPLKKPARVRMLTKALMAVKFADPALLPTETS